MRITEGQKKILLTRLWPQIFLCMEAVLHPTMTILSSEVPHLWFLRRSRCQNHIDQIISAVETIW